MRKVSLVLASVIATALANAAQAQTAPATQAADPAAERQDGGLEDIVVTAQKREQNLQDVPVAVTAITAAGLEAKNVTQFTNLTSVSPSLTIQEGTNATSSTISLRGIGTSVVSIGVEPSVAIVVDDVALLQQSQAFSGLNDIERIEVLRGPQGTLFGKNASAGAINIVTAAPTSALTGRIRVVATTDEEYRIEGGVSGPIGENVGFRLNAFFADRKGYVRNLATGINLGAEESWGVRGKLVANLSDTFEVSLAADYSHSDNNGVPRTLRNVPAGATVFNAPLAPDLPGLNIGPSNFVARQNINPDNTSEQYSFIGRARWSLGAVDLISITSYQNWSFTFFEDTDFSTRPVVGVPTGLFSRSPYEAGQFAQELRLVSADPGRLQYLVGLYYSDGQTDRVFDRGPSGPLLASWTATAGTRTLAAFVQGSYDITPTTHFDAGLRINDEKIDVSFRNRLNPATRPPNNATCLETCSGDASDGEATGKVALRQDLTDRVMAYVSYATGYKGQGYDVSTGFTPTRATRPVQPEKSKAYEIGLKSRFADNRVQLNVTGFWTDYNNFQAQSAVVLPDQSVQFQLNNVGKLRTRGVEVEVQTRPVDEFSFDISGAYTDAIIQSYPFANCYAGQTAAQGCFDVDGTGPGTATAQNLAGKRLQNAPEFKFNIFSEYRVPVASLSSQAFINLDYRWQSSVTFDLAQNPLLAQGSYGILNGSIGLRPDGRTGLTATIFVNNLFDKPYAALLGLLNGGSAGLLAQNLPRDARRYAGLRLGYAF